MRSVLYVGTTSHSRSAPARSAFRYPVYYLGVDLDELDALDSSLRLFSHNSANVVSLWDRDHGRRDGTPFRQWAEETCRRAGVDVAGGRIMLLTFPRVLGSRFFPVSFWYCFGSDDRVRAVLVEVHNTHRDHHDYLLHDGGDSFDFSIVHTATKRFFVSPFMPVGGVRYEFTLTEPGEHLRVSIRDVQDGSAVLTASIDLVARELSDATLRSAVLSFGPMSVVALVRIHWQALKLLFKRVPMYPYTKPPSEDATS